MGAVQVAVGEGRLVQFDEVSARQHHLRQLVALGVRAGAPVDPIGLGVPGSLCDPVAEGGIGRGHWLASFFGVRAGVKKAAGVAGIACLSTSDYSLATSCLALSIGRSRRRPTHVQSIASSRTVPLVAQKKAPPKRGQSGEIGRKTNRARGLDQAAASVLAARFAVLRPRVAVLRTAVFVLRAPALHGAS